MSNRVIHPPVTLFNAKGATGVSTALNVEGYKHIVVTVATDGGGDANLTLKFQGALSATAPTFSSAQSVTNMWDYIEVVDLEDGTHIDGDTGFSVAGADDYRMFEINVNHLKWFCCRVTARTEGEVTVVAKPSEE